jgi:hypothetical protein
MTFKILRKIFSVNSSKSFCYSGFYFDETFGVLKMKKKEENFRKSRNNESFDLEENSFF